MWWGQVPPQWVHWGNTHPPQETQAQPNQELLQLPGETATCKSAIMLFLWLLCVWQNCNDVLLDKRFGKFYIVKGTMKCLANRGYLIHETLGNLRDSQVCLRNMQAHSWLDWKISHYWCGGEERFSLQLIHYGIVATVFHSHLRYHQGKRATSYKDGFVFWMQTVWKWILYFKSLASVHGASGTVSFEVYIKLIEWTLPKQKFFGLCVVC